nr:MAG TPA: hypothetical protein [Caudoviricetes sp.]
MMYFYLCWKSLTLSSMSARAKSWSGERWNCG